MAKSDGKSKCQIDKGIHFRIEASRWNKRYNCNCIPKLFLSYFLFFVLRKCSFLIFNLQRGHSCFPRLLFKDLHLCPTKQINNNNNTKYVINFVCSFLPNKELILVHPICSIELDLLIWKALHKIKTNLKKVKKLSGFDINIIKNIFFLKLSIHTLLSQ